jgi:tetraacyldisaccharide 4'-kinase
VGGNGKTPFTLFLATRLRNKGLRTAIVSRGYGGRTSRSAALVSDGQRTLLTPGDAGDEPVMMAKSFGGPLAVAHRRLDAVELLAANALADLVVLDDGFQHTRLRRDLDLLLISQSLGFGNGRLLPSGPLREPPSAIQRADALVLIETSGLPGGAIDSATRELMRGKPLLQARLQPASLTHSDGGRWHQSPLTLSGRQLVAVSGVANAGGFHAMLKALGARLLATLDYPDHHNYSSADWEHILSTSRQAEMIITTEKDLVKLERLASPQLPLCALRLDVVMEGGDEQQLLSLITDRICRRELVPSR